ncbi:DUF4377 domain-containing protein [Pseudoruegeria sp. SHC-113]|uniref:DUF4377 domain-containing protein n=1 Tax=Pseudoruegeria sp. SHC-113 TaxID=2855439 RepID=UPI0021BA5A87|nr:DUF4377 domain-containing protein [Pseudoruegeria sp. SHC-113]MCT8158611.1 DUF4377 domain-containing protein [Pseudoruegeria sp. SHC-113]
MRGAIILAALAALAACESSTPAQGELLTFNIAADTQPCTGVAPMRCLIVNGAYFYDPIAGYTHVEGQPATLSVLRTPAGLPLPADAGAFTYKMVERLN